MTKPKNAADLGIEVYKVRVVVQGSLLHVLSGTEPVVTRGPAGEVRDVAWTVIEGTEHGDTVGYIRWPEVTAISWRKA